MRPSNLRFFPALFLHDFSSSPFFFTSVRGTVWQDEVSDKWSGGEERIEDRL